jgi:hypothetical protein
MLHVFVPQGSIEFNVAVSLPADFEIYFATVGQAQMVRKCVLKALFPRVFRTSPFASRRENRDGLF